MIRLDSKKIYISVNLLFFFQISTLENERNRLHSVIAQNEKLIETHRQQVKPLLPNLFLVRRSRSVLHDDSGKIFGVNLRSTVMSVRKGKKKILHWSCGFAVAMLKMRLLRRPEI